MQASNFTFIRDSCEVELALEQQCDHDPRIVHQCCPDCCQNSKNHVNPIEWDDLE